ncbi:MAG TPA: MarR family transcriptional regulator [Burkholderiaceae bacterium]|nr:MarR family transcriptional regulator [Burkholderiaceae bacterium]
MKMDASPASLDVLQQLRVVVRLAGNHSARVERRTGIPGAQLWALHEIALADGLRVGELAQRLRVHQTTVSNLLSRLDAAALVRKGRSRHDQRIVHVHLTAAGRKALKAAAAPARGLLLSVLDGMSAAQLRKVHDGLAVLVDHMGGFDAALAAKPLPFTESTGRSSRLSSRS